MKFVPQIKDELIIQHEWVGASICESCQRATNAPGLQCTWAEKLLLPDNARVTITKYGLYKVIYCDDYIPDKKTVNKKFKPKIAKPTQNRTKEILCKQKRTSAKLDEEIRIIREKKFITYKRLAELTGLNITTITKHLKILLQTTSDIHIMKGGFGHIDIVYWRDFPSKKELIANEELGHISQRQRKVLNIIKKEKFICSSEIAKRLGCSKTTIKKDVAKLAEFYPIYRKRSEGYYWEGDD